MRSLSTRGSRQLHVLPKLNTISQSDISPIIAKRLEKITNPQVSARNAKPPYRDEQQELTFKPLLIRRKLSLNLSLDDTNREETPLTIATCSKIRKQVINEMLNKSVEDVRERFEELRVQEKIAVMKNPLSKNSKLKRSLVSRSQFTNIYYQAAALPQKSKRRLHKRLNSVLPKKSAYSHLSVLDEAI
mmetsp:Transcript_4193/g.8417  ORF Transcript_4193/g.8417 Transcript_4193/m.8417 type:complete len:188 (-) Transcript_4193:27-590(-)